MKTLVILMKYMAESESSMNTKAVYVQSQYFTAACISRKPIVMD